MNDQNIQNIISYLKANESVPLAILEDSLVRSGYYKQEIDQALEWLNNSKQNINTSIIKKQKSNKKLIMIFVILLVLTIAIISLILFFNNQQIKEPVASTEPTATASPTPSPEQNNSVVSQPLTEFTTIFNTGDYKITTSGIIEKKIIDEENMGTGTTKINYNDGVFYTQKGSVVRIESNGEERPEIGILAGDLIYNLDPINKTYITIKTDDEIGQFYLTAFKNAFPFTDLIEATEKETITWTKETETEWTTQWNWKTPLDTESFPAKIKLRIDPTTKLIIGYSVNFEDSDSWQEAAFSYEKIESISDYLKPPTDYKEE